MGLPIRQRLRLPSDRAARAIREAIGEGAGQRIAPGPIRAVRKPGRPGAAAGRPAGQAGNLFDGRDGEPGFGRADLPIGNQPSSPDQDEPGVWPGEIQCKTRPEAPAGPARRTVHEDAPAEFVLLPSCLRQRCGAPARSGWAEVGLCPRSRLRPARRAACGGSAGTEAAPENGPAAEARAADYAAESRVRARAGSSSGRDRSPGEARMGE